MDVSFEHHDVITAIECLYYLTPDERAAFFAKLVTEHRGLFIMSAPIIDQNNYFTHDDIVDTLDRNGLQLVSWRNLTVYWRAGLKANVVKSSNT